MDYQLFAGHRDKKDGGWLRLQLPPGAIIKQEAFGVEERQVCWANYGQISQNLPPDKVFFFQGFGRVNPFNCHLVGGFKDFCFHPNPWGRFPCLLLIIFNRVATPTSYFLVHKMLFFFTMAYHVSHCRSCCLHSEYLRKYLKRRGLFCLYISNWVCESKMDPMGFFSNSHDLKIMKILQSS